MAHKLEDSKYVRTVAETWPKTIRRFPGTAANDYYKFKTKLYPCGHTHWLQCGSHSKMVVCDSCRVAKKTFPNFRPGLTIESRIMEVEQMIALAEEARDNETWRYGHTIIPYTPRAKSIAIQRLARLRERLKELIKILDAPT